jgi:drug/metabolite transporter (DMT)-like permease
MNSQVREPFGIRQLIASIFALGFLVGAVAALAVFVRRAGFDVSAGFGAAVAAAVTWLLIRVLSGSPYRERTIWMLMRSVAGVLVLLGPVLLVVLAYAPIFVHASDVTDERALLAVVGVLLLLATACAMAGGRRLIKDAAANGSGERS